MLRFPSGIPALVTRVHARGLMFGLYTSESVKTCAAYPGSRGFEALDAGTFARWGIDYLKVDACGDMDYYATGYPAIARAIHASGRSITLACSWAAYLGDVESQVPFQQFIDIGCNNDRFGYDIRCNWRCHH